MIIIKNVITHLIKLYNANNTFSEFSKEENLSYKELNEFSYNNYKQFKKTGINNDSRVLLLGENSKSFITSLIALWMNKAIVLPETINLEKTRLNKIKDRFKTDFIINSKENLILNLKENSSYNYTLKKEKINLDELRNNNYTENDDALCIYTSGSTGEPKGVLLTQKSLYNGGINVIENFRINKEDKAFCVLPMTHINGIVTTFITPLISESKVYYYQGIFEIEKAISEIIESKSTWMSAIPMHYTFMSEYEIKKQDLEKIKLKFCRSASSALPKKVLLDFENIYSIPLIETMGMTETCGQIFANPLPPDKHKPESVGKPINFNARIINNKNEVCDFFDIGDLEVKGNSLMKQYIDNPVATKETYNNGWLKTGDLAYVDKEGYFFLKGRKKNIAIFSGENISLSEIENNINNMDNIRDSVAIAKKNAIFGEVIEIFIILKKNHNQKFEFPLKKEILNVLKTYIPSINAIAGIYFVKNLPRTSVGKIDKIKIKTKTIIANRITINNNYNISYNIISNSLNIPINSLNCDSKMGDFFEWDSLGQVILLNDLEKYLNRKLTLREISLSKSVIGINNILKYNKSKEINYIEEKNNKKEKHHAKKLLKKILDLKDKESEIIHLIITINFLKKNNILNPQIFVDELIKLSNNNFGVIMNGFNWDFCKDIAYFSDFSPVKTGLVNELFRRNKFVFRTNHPIYSYLVTYNIKDEFIEEKTKSCWGKGSTSYKLLNRKDINVICGGIPVMFRNPIMHSLEEFHKVDYRFFKHFEGWVKFKKELEWYETKMFVRNLDLDFISDWTPLKKEMDKFSLIKYSASHLYRYNTEDVLNLGNKLLKNNKKIFFKKNKR